MKKTLAALLGFVALILTGCQQTMMLEQLKSEVAVANTPVVPGTVAAPVITPATGTYSTDQSVNITCSTPGATIHYTLDGSTPSVSTNVYTGLISVAGNGTTIPVKAIAVKNGMTDSVMALATITINYSVATLTTTAIGNITSTGATSGGNVTADNGQTITAKGICWSTSPNPTLTTNIGVTSSGTGTGNFSCNLTGLTGGTTYFVRAFATNAAGTSYGAQVSFTTSLSIPSGISATFDTSQVVLSWATVPGATNYKVFYQPGNTATTSSLPVSVGMITGTTSTVTGLVKNTLYAFVVVASTSAVDSPPSAVVNGTTLFAVGDPGQGGGFICYVSAVGFSEDGGSTTCHYLEAAPSDQSSGIQWFNGSNGIISTGTAVGTGKANTYSIIAAQGGAQASGSETYAATLCANYRGGSKSDWFLPSKDELDTLYPFGQNDLENLAYYNYWSSSQYNDGSGQNAWVQALHQGVHSNSQDYQPEGMNNYYVRAVRAF